MKNNNFENNIKESFTTYNPKLDHDAIWDNIEPHLKKKKKRRGFIWFWIMGLGLLILSINLLQKSKTEDQTVAPVLEIVEAAPQKKSIPESLSSKEKESNINASFPLNKEQKNKSKNTINQSYESSTFPKVKLIQGPKKIQNVSEVNSIVFPKTAIRDFVKTEKLVQEKEMDIEFETQTIPLPLLETLTLRLPSRIELKEKEMDYIVLEKTPIQPYKNKWRVFFQPTVGASYAIKTLKDRNNFETTFLRQRKDSETQLEGISAGFNIQLQNRKGFMIISGLEYQRINERFDHQEMKVETEVIDGVLAVIENANGQVIDNIMGDKEITITTTEKWQIYNQYNLLNIPIGVGKAIHRPKYDLKYSVGLDLNIFSRFKGTQFDQSLNTIYINEIQTENRIYKKSTGLGVWLGIEYQRPINKKTNWVIAPKIQIPLNSMTTKIYKLDQRYYRLSLNVGINILL